jgi:hypothetical protein
VSPYVETLSERLIQTLFDAQMQAGWAVRTVRECVEQAGADLATRTTMIDGRFIAGSGPGAEFAEVVEPDDRARPWRLRRESSPRTANAKRAWAVGLHRAQREGGQGAAISRLMWIARVSAGDPARDLGG